jgi:transcriptional regulator with XRE-family HTH domain
MQKTMDAMSMTPAALARASHSTTATISNWRNGNVDPEHVKAAQLYRISDALGVDGRWLLLGELGPTKVQDGTAVYGASHVVKSDVLKIALQQVREVLEEAKRTLPPAKEAEAVQLAYDLIEEGLPQAKVLRFVRAAIAA